MSTFQHKVSTTRELVTERESWSAEIDSQLVVVDRDDSGLVSLSIAPKSYDQIRLPLLKFYPKSVVELELLADALPDLLRAVAAELQAAGLSDLRSRIDKYMEDSQAAIEAIAQHHD